MAALNFPSSPANGDYHRENGATFRYNSTTTAWETMLTAAASGSGSGGPATYLDQNLGFTEGIKRIFIQSPAGADTNMMSIGAQIGGGGLTLFGYGHVSYPGRFELAAWSVAGQSFLIGTPLGELSWGGYISATRFVSSVTTGTAPLTVTSTTLVSNLHAHYARQMTAFPFTTDWATTFAQVPAHQRTWAETSSGGPAGTWWFIENMRHSNGTSTWGTQLAWGWEDNRNQLWQRNVQGGSWDAWVRYFNSGTGSTAFYTASDGTYDYINFDANDSYRYNRTLNHHELYVNNVRVMYQSATEFYSAPTTNFSVEVGTRAFYINATTGTSVIGPFAITGAMSISVTTLVTNLNADYLDGYHASSAATGNTVALRDASGYMNAVIFNMSYAEENSAASHVMYQYNSDGYLRRKTLANFKDEMFKAVTNGYSGGPASKSFNVTDSNGTHTFSSVWQGLIYVREYTYGNHCLLIFDSSNGVTIVSQNAAGLFVYSSTPGAGKIGVYVSGGYIVFKNNTGWGTITLRAACLSADTLPN